MVGKKDGRIVGWMETEHVLCIGEHVPLGPMTYEITAAQMVTVPRQSRRTSPTTGSELATASLVSLEALRKAIETYITQRPELKSQQTANRSFTEECRALQRQETPRTIVASTS